MSGSANITPVTVRRARPLPREETFTLIRAQNPALYVRNNAREFGPALDRSGNNRHGTHIGPVGLREPGAAGTPNDPAILYEGSAYTEFAHNAAYNVANASFSFECFVRVLRTDRTLQMLFTKSGGTDATTQFELRTHDNNFEAVMKAANAAAAVVFSSSAAEQIKVGESYHVAFKYDKTNASGLLLLNGFPMLPAIIGAVNEGYTANNLRIMIAGRHSGDNPADAIVDECAYYPNAALSDMEILSHAMAGLDPFSAELSRLEPAWWLPLMDYRSDAYRGLPANINNFGSYLVPTGITVSDSLCGSVGWSRYWNGGYINIGNAPELNFLGAFTITFLILYNRAPNGTSGVIFTKYGDTAGSGWGIGLDVVGAGKIGFWTNGSGQWTDTNATIDDGQVHLYTAVFENGNLTLYLDGFGDSLTPKAGPTQYFNEGNNYVGATLSGGLVYYPALSRIQHIAAFGYALNPQQVRRLWLQAVGDYNRDAIGRNAVVYLRMSARRGTVEYDLVGRRPFVISGTPILGAATAIVGGIAWDLAIDFTGGAGFLSFTGNATAFIAGESFTIDGILKTTGPVAGNTQQYIVARGVAGYRICLDATGQLLFITSPNGSVFDTATATPANFGINLYDGQFHWFACVFDRSNSQKRIYIDGVLMYVAGFTDFAQLTGVTTYIGRDYTDTNRFNGVLDGIGFYSKAFGRRDAITRGNLRRGVRAYTRMGLRSIPNVVLDMDESSVETGDAISGYTRAGNGFTVGRWRNKLGGTLHAIPPSYNPSFVDKVRNGLGAIYFGGVGTEHALRLGAIGANFNTGVSLFMAFCPDNIVQTYALYSTINSEYDPWIADNGPGAIAAFRTAPQAGFPTFAVQPGQWQLVEIHADATRYWMYLNGNVYSTGAAYSVGDEHVIAETGDLSEFYQGYIGQLFAVGRFADARERELIRATIADRWSIALP